MRDWDKTFAQLFYLPDYSMLERLEAIVACEIKPVRIMILFLAVGLAASMMPTEVKVKEIMTPFHQTYKGIYGDR